MRVLIDFHHHDLYESMVLLCARLGWTLYRPIGMEWFDEGYWNFERLVHGDRVAKQYLEPWGNDKPGLRWDVSHEHFINTLTLAEARDLKPDIVIASVAHNHEGLHRFATEIGATFGIHLGNVRFSHIDMAEDRWDLAQFGIVTTKLPEPIAQPHVVVHQEFSLADFHYEPGTPGDRLKVASFVNCFAENEKGYAQFIETANANPQHDWQVYGSYGSKPEDGYACGNLGKCADVAAAMRATDIAWHTKQWSDGFGFVIHNWFAVGRPVLGYEWYYRNQLAGPLWQEGVTSFDLTDKTAHEVGNLLAELQREPERIVAMGAAAAKRFREVVDYDAEEQAIRAMFSTVLP